MSQKSKVLVVEDDEGIRQSLFETLGAWDLPVGGGSQWGRKPQVQLRMVNYDAVLLDINMPGMGARRRVEESVKPFLDCRSLCLLFVTMKRISSSH